MEAKDETNDKIVKSSVKNEPNCLAPPENAIMDKPESKISGFPWATLIIALAIVAICAISSVALFLSVRTAANVPKDLFKDLNKEIVEITFRDHLTEIISTGGEELGLVIARYDVIFSDKRSKKEYGLYLGTTESEILVPVTFRYHLRLSDKWYIEPQNCLGANVCTVVAPSIRPTQPPAIHTDKMEQRTKSGWARFDKVENLLLLQKSMTPKLEQLAGDLKHISNVREECRKSVKEFVEKFVKKGRGDGSSAIVVKFSDEVSSPSDQELEQSQSEPTVTLALREVTRP